MNKKELLIFLEQNRKEFYENYAQMQEHLRSMSKSIEKIRQAL